MTDSRGMEGRVVSVAMNDDDRAWYEMFVQFAISPGQAGFAVSDAVSGMDCLR